MIGPTVLILALGSTALGTAAAGSGDAVPVQFETIQFAADRQAPQDTWIEHALGEERHFDSPVHAARVHFTLEESQLARFQSGERRIELGVLSLGTIDARCTATLNGHELSEWEDPWRGPRELRGGPFFEVGGRLLVAGDNELWIQSVDDLGESGMPGTSVLLLPPSLAERFRDRLGAEPLGYDCANLEMVTFRAADSTLHPRFAMRDRAAGGRFRLHGVIDVAVRDTSGNDPALPFSALVGRSSTGKAPFVSTQLEDPSIVGMNLRGLGFVPNSPSNPRNPSIPLLVATYSNPRTGPTPPPLDLSVTFFPMRGGPLHGLVDDEMAVACNQRLCLAVSSGKFPGGADAPSPLVSRMKVPEGGAVLAGPTTDLLVFPHRTVAENPESTNGASDDLDAARSFRRRILRLRPDTNDFGAIVPVEPHLGPEQGATGLTSVQFGKVVLSTRRTGEGGYAEWIGDDDTRLVPERELAFSLLYAEAAERALRERWPRIEELGDDVERVAAFARSAANQGVYRRSAELFSSLAGPLAELLERHLQRSDPELGARAAELAAAATALRRWFEAMDGDAAIANRLAEHAARWARTALAQTPGDAEAAVAQACLLVTTPTLSETEHAALLDRVQSFVAANPDRHDDLSILALSTLAGEGRFTAAKDASQRLRDTALEHMEADVSPAVIGYVQFALCGVSRERDGSWRIEPKIEGTDDFQVKIGTATGTVSIRCHPPNTQFQRQFMLRNDSQEPTAVVVWLESRLGKERAERFGTVFSLIRASAEPGKSEQKTAR